PPLLCRTCLDPSTPAISTLSLHDALPIFGVGLGANEDAHRQRGGGLGRDPERRRRGEASTRTGRSPWRILADDDRAPVGVQEREDRKSTRLNSSHVSISYAVFCLKKKKYQ